MIKGDDRERGFNDLGDIARNELKSTWSPYPEAVREIVPTCNITHDLKVGRFHRNRRNQSALNWRDRLRPVRYVHEDRIGHKKHKRRNKSDHGWAVFRCRVLGGMETVSVLALRFCHLHSASHTADTAFNQCSSLNSHHATSR